MAVTAQGSGTRTPPLGTVTMTIASPCVVTYNSHGLVAGDKVVFTTTGSLPTGITAGTTYFVISAGIATNTFEISATDGGSAVNTSGSQSGTHSIVAETALLDVAAAGVYSLHVDLNAMASADAMELRIYQMILTGGTRRVAYYNIFNDAQPTDGLIAVSVPIANELTDAGALRFSLRQFAGTARAFPWKVLKY